MGKMQLFGEKRGMADVFCPNPACGGVCRPALEALYDLPQPRNFAKLGRSTSLLNNNGTNDMPHVLKDQEIAMLRSEIEMFMKERQTLLRVTGAAAVFVAELDSNTLPAETYEAAELLAEYLNETPEETLNDALEAVKAGIVGLGEASA